MGLGVRASGGITLPFLPVQQGPQAAQVVRSLGGSAASGKEGPFVSLQKLNPWGDIARAPNVSVKAKLGAQESGTQLRNEFLSRVITRAEPVL